VWYYSSKAHRYILDVRDKKKLTEELVKQIDPELGITVKRALHTWWFNLRSAGGMRLTTQGYHTFCNELDMVQYSFAIDDPTTFNQHMILNLDRKMQTPYYIHAVKGIPKKIIFFGSKEAMMANLYGDLERFLSNY
jgi:hypothetical protein